MEKYQDIYPGHIRYAEYSIAENIPEEGSSIKDVLEEYGL